MKSIYTIKNPNLFTDSVDIFNPSRGTSGTLCYMVKVDDTFVNMEINDDGDWEVTNKSKPIAGQLLSYISELIYNLETMRLGSGHSVR